MADDPERVRALQLLKRYGWNSTSFQILEPGLSYWFDGDACVAYRDTGDAWVAAGAPVAAPDRLAEVAAGFATAAREARRRCCFFATESRFGAAADVHNVTIGEQPVWDPTEWEETLRRTRSLKEQLRRARAKGVTVRAVDPVELREGTPMRARVDAVIARWLGSRPMAPMGFLVQVDPFSFADEKRYFVAEVGERVVGFLAAVPVYARKGWFLEDLLRDPAAPNGTAELLVDSAMRSAAAEQGRYLTLGLAPLAGEVNVVLRAARAVSSALYDFRGVHAFKAKLRPRTWEPIYLTYPSDEGGVRATFDALTAFSRVGLLRFGLETLLRGPAIAVRALALLLVPWTLLLALAGQRWFPAPWIKWGWVAFDVALAAALLELTVRWRRRLATVLATLVTLDAATTLVQGLVWNAPRARGSGDFIVIVVSILAPTLAAFLLWRARAHRMRWQ